MLFLTIFIVYHNIQYVGLTLFEESLNGKFYKRPPLPSIHQVFPRGSGIFCFKLHCIKCNYLTLTLLRPSDIPSPNAPTPPPPQASSPRQTPLWDGVHRIMLTFLWDGVTEVAVHRRHLIRQIREIF